MKRGLVILSVLMILSVAILGCSQPDEVGEKVSPEINKAVDYINEELLRSGIEVKLLNYSSYGDDLYRLTLNFTLNETGLAVKDVFLTKDGDVLILDEKCLFQINETFEENPVDNAVHYINKELVSPGITAELVNVSSFGEDLVKLKLEIKRNDTFLGMEEVYLTKDGRTVVVGSGCVVDMYYKFSRENVTAGDDPYLGSENAKITIIEFSDFTCPYCARFENEILPQILEKYGDDVKFVFKDFPIHGNISILAATAANCAGEQNKYWEYHRMLFESQSEWMRNVSMLHTYAEELDLNLSEFDKCLNSSKYVEEINEDRDEGLRAGVSGTPTLFINGIKIVGAQPFEKFSKIIESELSK
jgi:predicted DsbA family dithiol-disulfide isomerase